LYACRFVRTVGLVASVVGNWTR